MGLFTFFFITPLIVLLISIVLVMLNTKAPLFHEKNLNARNIEIVLTEKTNILKDDGSLNLIGWGRNPNNYSFDPNKIK